MTEQIARRTLALPFFTDHEPEAQVDYVCERVNAQVGTGPRRRGAASPWPSHPEPTGRPDSSEVSQCVGSTVCAGISVARARELLARMNAAIAHRGHRRGGSMSTTAGKPDWVTGLSILDRSPAGHQPMSDPRGQLRPSDVQRRDLQLPGACAGLKARVIASRSRTDTEVLIYLYLEHGQRMLEQAQRDVRVRDLGLSVDATLFAARDHFGIKPFSRLPPAGEGRLVLLK